MAIDLNQFNPITELDKQELLDWLVQILDDLSNGQVKTWDNVVNLNTTNNRIFGTSRDDVDETIDMFGRFAVTLLKCNIFAK